MNNSQKSVTFLERILMDDNRSYYVEEKFKQIEKKEQERERRGICQKFVASRKERVNRYSDIIPYCGNRVKLTDERLGSDDYINASPILAPYEIPRYYIATQGPLLTTIIDFWRMVIEKKVAVIVCLTAEKDNGVEKCARYWPVGKEETRFSKNNIHVVVKNISEIDDRKVERIVRRISVEFRDASNSVIESASVTQIQFLGWPDHGVPKSTSSVLALIDLTRQLQEQNKPVLVHCSAGCGRTGTFCVIDSVEVLLRRHPDNLIVDPIFLITDEFRKQRTTMVQSLAQYMFCYEAVKDYVDQEE